MIRQSLGYYKSTSCSKYGGCEKKHSDEESSVFCCRACFVCGGDSCGRHFDDRILSFGRVTSSSLVFLRNNDVLNDLSFFLAMRRRK